MYWELWRPLKESLLRTWYLYDLIRNIDLLEFGNSFDEYSWAIHESSLDMNSSRIDITLNSIVSGRMFLSCRSDSSLLTKMLWIIFLSSMVRCSFHYSLNCPIIPVNTIWTANYLYPCDITVVVICWDIIRRLHANIPSLLHP